MRLFCMICAPAVAGFLWREAAAGREVPAAILAGILVFYLLAFVHFAIEEA